MSHVSIGDGSVPQAREHALAAPAHPTARCSAQMLWSGRWHIVSSGPPCLLTGGDGSVPPAREIALVARAHPTARCRAQMLSSGPLRTVRPDLCVSSRMVKAWGGEHVNTPWQLRRIPRHGAVIKHFRPDLCEQSVRTSVSSHGW